MRLSALAKGLTVKDGRGDPEVTLVTEDSRKVRPGAVFVAVRGTLMDGHTFVRQALDRGAVAVVVEDAGAVPPGSPHVIVPSSVEALGLMAARFHGNPAASLELIGFTGTFGKTTTSDILRALLEAAGSKPAVIGSLGARFGAFHDPGEGLTTPAAPELHAWLAELKRRGADSVIMEVTSHALRLRRVRGLTFAGGLLAAIMPGEHTDFHRTYADYVAAKRLFLDYLAPDALLAYDADNRAARQLAADAAVGRKAGFSMGAWVQGALEIRHVRLDQHGAAFDVNGSTLRSALLGRPNARNAALALTYALASGLSLDAATPVLAALRPLPRRMERTTAGGRVVLDDTSGHPDSLMSLFEVVELIPRERLWIVWAIRGSRGVDVNRANALALADLASLHGAEDLVVTAAADATEPKDGVAPEEVDTVRAALALRGRGFAFHDALTAAVGDVATRSRPGDLIVLAGAQGMDRGRPLLDEMLAKEERPS